MAYKAVTVPVKTITSVDIPNMSAGLFLNGDQDGPNTSFVASKDVELTKEGFLVPRRTLYPFLPDTVETTYQKAPMLWNGMLYYFTLDNGKAVYCKEGDSSWTACGGANTFITNNGGKPTFLRVLNTVLVLNGTNGDKIAQIDLTTNGFPVVEYEFIADPTTALTATSTNLTIANSAATATPFPIYYAYTFSGPVGETALSPILTKYANLTRDQWTNNVSSPSSITLTRPAAPDGATGWSVYAATAATTGDIQSTDMLQIASSLDIKSTTFNDNGELAFNLGGVAPDANSTDGFKADHGIVEDGTPIIWGDVDNPYDIHIGGGGFNALSFSTANGAYLAEPQLGTNYYPSVIVGYHIGTGGPALTVLYSNTEGLSKQAVLQQQTVNYGDQSFTVWGTTEQYYGAAGVAAPYSAINYNNNLMFLSTDGFANAKTQPSVQNVLSISSVDGPIDPYVRSIKNEAMDTVVSTGWNNKFLFTVPANGFDTPQQILVLDTNSKGVEGNGAWMTLDIPAQWLGTVSPANSAAFVYVCQGKSTYKLLLNDSSFDTKSGARAPFSTGATGALVGMGGTANVHNSWQAIVQTMFYIEDLVGTITVGVRYRNQNGTLKTKQKTITGPTYTPSSGGGWGDTQYTYAGFPLVPSWGSSSKIDDRVVHTESIDKRVAVQINDITNEAQWFYSTPVGYNNYKLRGVSHEGIALGVRPDLQ